MIQNKTRNKLRGRLVVMTRSPEDNRPLRALLESHGADTYELPCIRMNALPITAKFRRAMRRIDSFDFIIFTSARAVAFFMEGSEKMGVLPKALHRIPLVAIGPATKKELSAYGLKTMRMPVSMPTRFDSESMIERMKKISELKGKRILIPRSKLATPELVDWLKKMGAKVTPLVLYTAIHLSDRDLRFEKLLSRDKTDSVKGKIGQAIDCITFASPSAVIGFSKRVKNSILKIKARDILALCIGPSTARAARKSGFKETETAKTFTIEGMVAKLLDVS